MKIEALFDPRSYTLTYIAWDEETRDAVVIDPVLDFDGPSGKVWTESAKAVVDFVKSKELTIHYILETHAHADHLSSSKVLQKVFPEAKVAIGARIKEVQVMFKGVLDLAEDFPTDGSQFDALLEHGSVTKAGSLEFETLFTPGHTPACSTFKFGDVAFVGDALFMPDQGAGRCDFPGGSATALYASVHDVLYKLPDDTKVYIGHDYQPGGRELEYLTTIGAQKAHNVALPEARDEADFVQWREARDATLSAPKLIFQSVQVNVDAGNLPKPAGNKMRYLKIPLNAFRPPSSNELELELV